MAGYEELRVTKLRQYLIGVINSLASDKKNRINANMLSNDVNNYSIDKMPMNPQVEKWIIPIRKKKDVYSFRSRMAYSQDTITNLKNIGFFEKFEEMISSNNKEGILPDIDGIESIECLNCGTMNNAGTNTAEFDIQIQIIYRSDIKENEFSL